MIIELKKFGNILSSRQNGREAFLGFSSNLKDISVEENVIVDFSGVDVFTPSWGDEFLTSLQKKFQDKLVLEKTKNSSVLASVDILEKTNGVKFNWKK